MARGSCVRSRNGYSALDWAALRAYAESLTGRADVFGLIERLGYADEEQLRDANGGRNLLQLLEGDGKVFENLLEIRERLSAGRVGSV